MKSRQPSPDSFNSRKEHFAHILGMSEAMLELARSEEWEQLAQLESLRRHHYEYFFDTTPGDEEAVWIKQGIERLLEIDKKLIEVSEAAKQAIADSSKNLAKGQSATKAYNQP